MGEAALERFSWPGKALLYGHIDCNLPNSTCITMLLQNP